MNDRELLLMAEKASKSAYIPYSKFPVGAALECKDGTIYTGCNIENASIGGTICAERVAAVKAISDGNTEFSRIAVHGEGDNYCLPCGICRQFLSEFTDDLEFLCSKAGGAYVSYKMSELLPYAFKL